MMTKRNTQEAFYWFLVRLTQGLMFVSVILITIIIMGDYKIKRMEQPTVIQWGTTPRESVEEEFKRYIQSLPMPEMNDVPVIQEQPVVIQGDIVETAVEERKDGLKELNVSAYCACEECCGKSDGITASNTKAQQWHTVAAGSNYKFGTKIYISALENTPSGGWFVVEDRGGKIDDSHLDVYFEDHQEAKKFGRHNYECIIYN